MRLALAVIAAVVVATPARGTTHVIRNDLGGRIYKYELRYANPSDRWIVDGECTSACTLVLGTGRACATRRARFGFHAGSVNFGNVVSRVATEQMYRHYPAPVQAWVNRHAAMSSLRVTFMRQPEVANYLPACSG